MADVEQNFGSGLLGYVMLMDPSTGKPYRATNIVQQTDGDFNTEGLATADMQQQELAVLNALSTKLSAPLTVEVDNAEMPLPAGASTDAKQDSMITALGNLAALLGGTLSVSVGGQPLEAQITSSALPTGASTAAKQAEVKTALDAVLTALAGVLQVSGDVNVSSDEPLTVEGTVHMDNTTFSVTPSGTFNVSVTGGATSEKQDSLIATLQDVLTRLTNPLKVTDGGTPVAVNGVVGVSGTVPTTQSGTWNVGINGTPSVNIANTSVPVSGSVALTGTPNVNVTNASLPVTQSGAWSVGVSGTANVNVTNASAIPVSLASVPTHPVTQSGTFTVTPSTASSLITSPTAVSVGTTSVSIISSQSTRRSLIVQNMGGTVVYLSFAATATTTAPTFQLSANNWILIDRETWTGAVSAIRASGSTASDVIVTVTT